MEYSKLVKILNDYFVCDYGVMKSSNYFIYQTADKKIEAKLFVKLGSVRDYFDTYFWNNNGY